MATESNRAQSLLQALNRAWQANPELRLGQLIVNAAGLKEPQPGIFYVEDTQLLAGLDKLAGGVES